MALKIESISNKNLISYREHVSAFTFGFNQSRVTNMVMNLYNTWYELHDFKLQSHPYQLKSKIDFLSFLLNEPS